MKYCKNTLAHTQRYGGWFLYLKLVIQLYGQIPQYWKMVGQLNEGKIITRFMIINLIIKMVLKTPWWLFIKPFGCLFSMKIKYVGNHRETNDRIIDYSYKKIGIIYFLHFIPVWFIYGKRMNKADKKRLFKDKKTPQLRGFFLLYSCSSPIRFISFSKC